MNGVIHAVAVNDGWYRIDKVDIAAQSVTTLVNAQPRELRAIATHYSGSSLAIAAISTPDTILVGPSFADAAANNPVVTNGTNPDLYCDGSSMILRGQSKNRRVLQVYDLNSGQLDNYGSGDATSAKTLC
ncbi:hypothetical protein P7228_00810 [Altererythrobacter arenosus]|uniref:Uncharacterized protein n=1 Tax=Altererythrobacter arenosus TaxID=3032592 RepID=A0ABY8FRJ5_9SPHN|nr:hypothetical protein [Altererythrobacter sp. CAU 1644]WFL77636.1 hypothetical protein P7228_00810 [Altererythrobacter sp. CAU 1644]